MAPYSEGASGLVASVQTRLSGDTGLVHLHDNVTDDAGLNVTVGSIAVHRVNQHGFADSGAAVVDVGFLSGRLIHIRDRDLAVNIFISVCIK